jgi:ferredoxin
MLSLWPTYIVALSLFLSPSRGFQTPRLKGRNSFRSFDRPSSSSLTKRDDTAMATSSTSTTLSTYEVQVLYENQSTTISVHQNETILSALERHQISDQLSISNHVVPSDCRRGNCLTCTATHTTNSNINSVVTDDGLSPHISRWMQDKGFLLTCSSQVVGDGLQLRLGENIQAWEEIYQTRLENDHARIMGWTAMARTKRKSDERNVPRWTQETEGVFGEKQQQ